MSNTSPLTVDYIIIGAGSSGCVLANRLSANPDIKVLLLEAGGADVSPFIHMPASINRVKDNPRTDWCYKTTPQAQLSHRAIPIPRGKTLGGSSSINAMVYIRGQREDYDHWQELGASGWDYNSVLPYFKQSECNNSPDMHSDYHGNKGPLHVCHRSYSHPLSDTFIDAAVEAGITHNPDFNGQSQAGVGHYQVTQVNRKRCSSAVAYLHPIKQRPNLQVETKAHVLKILMQKSRVTGVQYQHKGELKTVHVNAEVILSAGAINSPQILMLSGIGPQQQLTHHDIKVNTDLSGVGQNLQDHLNISVLATTKDPISLAGIGKGLSAPKVALQYWWNRTGPGTSNGAEAGAFVSTHLSPGRPDVQLHFIPMMLGTGMHDTGIHGITIHACNLRPSDVGEVRLGSNQPMQAPIIDNRFLTADDNIHTMREGLAVARDIIAARPLAKLIASEHLPSQKCTSKEQLDQYVRDHAETEYHPVGTCKMGTDNEAVVDAQLRVYGIANLRVVDASIMPKLISGNTNAACIMIAEKAADMIINGQ